MKRKGVGGGGGFEILEGGVKFSWTQFELSPNIYIYIYILIKKSATRGDQGLSVTPSLNYSNLISLAYMAYEIAVLCR